MIVTLGPIEFRLASGNNWSTAELALVSGRKGGLAQRETAVRAAFKSEHLLELAAEDNPQDAVTIDGVTYTGKKADGIDADSPHVLSAQQVAARAIRNQRLREAGKPEIINPDSAAA